MTQESIFGEIQPAKPPQPIEEDTSDIVYSKGLIRSSVQKAVRRHMPDEAIVLAKAYIRLDIHDFCRRLMVIVLEDSLLHPRYNELYKITVATQKKSYIATEEDKSTLLTIVYDIANSTWRDTEYSNPDNQNVQGEYEYLSDTLKEYIDALSYRLNAGGLYWDKVMIGNFKNIWTHRFANGFTLEKLQSYFEPSPDISFSDVRAIKREDMPLVAVDFHAFPPIKRMLLGKPYIQQLLDELEPIRKEHWADAERDLFLQYLMWWSYVSACPGRLVFWYEPPAELNRMVENLQMSPENQAKVLAFGDAIIDEVKSIANWYLTAQERKHKENQTN